MRHSIFWVGDRPHCVWGADFQEKTLEFIRGIDPDYYDYHALTHHRNLDRKKIRARAALALRAQYHHGLETLFSLLGGTLQAPYCIAAWLQLCRTETLRTIIAQIGNGRLERTLLRLERVTWNSIAELVHRRSGGTPERRADTSDRFATLWTRFAYDFLDQRQVAEYNAIKHGLRVRSGGFGLQVGIEHEYGVPPPKEEMRTVVNSELGSTYFFTEPVEQGRGKARDTHIVLAERSHNWDATGIAIAIRLIAMSINNIRSFLLVLHGEPGPRVKFVRPEDGDYFELPWRLRPSISNFDLRFPVDTKQVRRFPSERLRQLLEDARRQLLDELDRTAAAGALPPRGAITSAAERDASDPGPAVHDAGSSQLSTRPEREPPVLKGG